MAFEYREGEARRTPMGLLKTGARRFFLSTLDLPDGPCWTTVQEEQFGANTLPQCWTLADLKRQYRQLARRLHPDKNDDDDAHEQFTTLGTAYNELLKEHDVMCQHERKRIADNAASDQRLTRTTIDTLFRQKPAPPPPKPERKWAPRVHTERVFRMPDVDVDLHVSLADIYRGCVVDNDDKVERTWSVTVECDLPCIDCIESICTLHTDSRKYSASNPYVYKFKQRPTVYLEPGALNNQVCCLPYEIGADLLEDDCDDEEQSGPTNRKSNSSIRRYWRTQRCSEEECRYYFVANVRLVETTKSTGFYRETPKPLTPQQYESMSSEQRQRYRSNAARLYYKVRLDLEQALTSCSVHITHLSGDEVITVNTKGPHCLLNGHKVRIRNYGMPLLNETQTFNLRDDCHNGGEQHRRNAEAKEEEEQTHGDLIVEFEVRMPTFFMCDNERERMEFLRLCKKYVSYEQRCTFNSSERANGKQQQASEKHTYNANDVFNVVALSHDEYEEQRRYEREQERRMLRHEQQRPRKRIRPNHNDDDDDDEEEDDEKLTKRRRIRVQEQRHNGRAHHTHSNNACSADMRVQHTRAYYKRSGQSPSYLQLE